MSELYLTLRTRLESVTEWVYIDTDILRSARERRGLSYETMARTIPVAAKTWERYEKDGRVPRHLVMAVAKTLELEIEQPAAQSITVPPADSSDELRLLILDVDEKVDRLLKGLAFLLAQQVGADAADAALAIARAGERAAAPQRRATA